MATPRQSNRELFHAAFGPAARAERAAEQERLARQRSQLEDLNRRREWLASLRPAGGPNESES